MLVGGLLHELLEFCDAVFGGGVSCEHVREALCHRKGLDDEHVVLCRFFVFHWDALRGSFEFA